MDCSPPGSSVLGILQARMFEWVATSVELDALLPGIFPTQGWNLCLLCLLIGRQVLLVFFPCIYVYHFFFFCFKILYWFCHTLTWIHHECTCVPHAEPPSHLLPHPIPPGHPSAPTPSTLYHASNLDWQFVSHMIIYMVQCHSPILSRPRRCPRPLPQRPKGYSIHVCHFFCLTYRVIVTIFLNSIYMC